MSVQKQSLPVSPQVVPDELPGARKTIPQRALWISLAALAVAVYGAFSSPEILGGYDALSWLLILVPAFLLAYYRGWRGTAWVLIAGVLVVLGAQLVAQYVFRIGANWALLYWVAVILVGIGLGIAGVSGLLQRERRDALVMAYSDALTGLPNRRLLDFMLEKEFAAGMRGRPVSIVLFDIDGFDAYNNQFGRAAGDEALRQVAATLDRQMRMMNVGGRYAGDAFLAILSGENMDGAWVFAERTRKAIEEIELPTGPGPTVSVGIAQYELWMRAPEELVASVRKALWRARNQGGNRVICETPEERERELPAAVSDLPPEMQEALEKAWRRQAVEDAEVRYRKLFDGVPVGLYRATPDGEILDANPAFMRMFRYPNRQSLLEVNAAELYADPADRERWQKRIAEEPLLREYEVRLRRRDGSIFWTRDTARAVLGAGGSVRYYQGVLEDIDAKKQAEEELLEATEKLRAVFDAAPVAVIALDLEGRVQGWNPGAETIFGWSEEEALGRLPPFVSEEREEGHRELLRRVAGGESVIGVEVRRQRRDGSQLDLSVYTAPLYGKNGSVSGIMGILVDITERRELQARLAQSQRMESIGRLAGGIAHDFNNLLTVILGNCEIVLKDLAPSSPQRGDVEDIRAAADHAAKLTRQLLAFSRRQILQPKVLSLNNVVTETLEMLRRIIGEDIELVAEFDPALVNALADPVEIGQVVMNLAVNARDAMQGSGRLTLKTENVVLEREMAAQGEMIPPGSYAMLAVADTGVGMDRDTLSKIFEPFFTTKPKGEGTGLGLAMVYGIIKQSGGYIAAESQIGRGTCVRIYLPQHDSVLETAEPEVVAVTPGSETILLVEDEAALRGPVRRGLEREGYTVLEASNATEALEICERHKGEIDVMVTDVVMPGMDGLELGRHVARLRPHTRILYTSGYTEDITRDGVIDVGDFLQKPYTPSELGSKIRQMLA